MSDGTIPITESQKDTAYGLLKAILDGNPGVQPALAAATLDGEPVAVILILRRDLSKDGESVGIPVAILLDEALHEHFQGRLLPPEGIVIQELDEGVSVLPTPKASPVTASPERLP